MTDHNSRALQASIDAIEALANMSANPANDHGDVTESTGESDMDYEPATEDDESLDLAREAFIERLLDSAEGDEAEDEEGDEDDDGTEYAEIGVEIEETTQDDDPVDPARILAQRRNVIRLLQNTEVGRLFRFVTNDDLDEDEDDGDFNPRWRRRRRPRPDPDRFPKVPSPEGIELMNSGAFGSNEAQNVTSNDVHNIGKKKKLALRILDRELAVENPVKWRLNNRLMAQGMIPSSNADVIIHYDQPVYSGQFSDDGNFFFSANKDYHVRMYDTSNPYKWRYYKTVEYPFGQWTLTDASLSPDNKYLAYTSIRSTVCLAPTDPNDMGDPYILDLSDRGNDRQGHHGFRARFGGSFGIWSIRYSGDGRELVAGTTGGSIVVYDIESCQPIHRIFGHDEDVNAVCFADKSSPHILYSGSDDTTLKVWDTRSMGDSRAAGAFVGHIEGITYIDSKGDGRYVLSNGKDQSMKLWDLRMVMPSRDFERIKPLRRATDANHFDYRWGTYDEDDWYKDEYDNSVVTFRGHKVLRTLIRCHFSPPASTNSRYVYSGSEDGKVYIWNMDATLAGTIDVLAATKDSRPRANYYATMGRWDDDEDDIMRARWRTCVRDVSWHPNAPMIVASAWNGYGMSTGTCTAHSWNDGAEDDEAEPKMGLRVDEKLRPDEEYNRATSPPLPRREMRAFLRPAPGRL